MGMSEAMAAPWPTAGRPVVEARAVAPGRLPARDPGSADPVAALAGLVRRMVDHDESALSVFYDATIARAYGLALRIVRNAALAEEVVADAYHQAWREAARFDSARGNPLAWMLVICRTRALDALRARDPAIAHEDPASLVGEAESSGDGDPMGLVAAGQASAAVHRALAKLSAVQRQMVALAFYRGLTHQEIAAQTHQPLGTVKSQIRRALAAMRTELETKEQA